MVGRLHSQPFISFWENEIKAPRHIINILKGGFKVLFEGGESPKAGSLPNNRSALKNKEFTGLTIIRMLEVGICEEVASPPMIINPLTVADTGKMRLVLDVSRTINPIFRFKKTVLGTLHDFNAVADKGYFQAVMDVKSAYYHILINVHQRK